jgi:tetratricopeptide (TPR) repeat protein
MSQHDTNNTQQQALSLLPKPRYHYNLAVSYQTLGEVTKAIEGYRECLALDEQGIPDAHFNLGVALQETGDMEGASEHYLRAYELDFSNAGALGNHCNVLQALGADSNKEAEACYQVGRSGGLSCVGGCLYICMYVWGGVLNKGGERCL